MENLILESQLSNSQIVDLSFALGKAYEDIKKYEDSFFYLKKANMIKKKEYNYDIKLLPGCYRFHFSDEMEDGISIHWWYRNSNPDKMGINGSVEIRSLNGEELHKFNPDFGQELRLNFLVE